MKLKLFLWSFFTFICAGEAYAANAGLRYINTRGLVRCGTDLTSDTYAAKDEDGYWHGIDSDLCKIFATAILGRSDRFEMVNVGSNSVSKALSTNKIDIMFGSAPYSASTEINSRAAPVAAVYYDKQMFLAKKLDGADSMEAYKGAKVCTVSASEDLSNLQEYNDRYRLDFGILQFNSINKAREAFLLNRCTLLTGNELYLKSVQEKNFANKDNVALLPEVIAVKPIYAFTAKDNTTLNIVSKWIINALRLAEEKGIDSNNIKVYIGANETSVQNLLGDNPKLWEKFGLKPQWVRKAIAETGNFGEIYEKNIGMNSKLQIERGPNHLVKNKGLIIPQPFL